MRVLFESDGDQAMLLTVLSGFFLLLSTLLGVLVTIFPKWLGPTARWWVIGAFVTIGLAGGAVDIGKHVVESRDAERLEAQITGRGGWAYVVAMGLLEPPVDLDAFDKPARPDSRGIGLFDVLNPSDISVFDVRVTIMQRVPYGEGFQGSDTVMHGTYEARAVHPHDAPTHLVRRQALRADRPNIFSFAIWTRAALLLQTSVVVWKDGAWQSDYELKVSGDTDRGNEERVLHEMGAEFEQLAESTMVQWYNR